MGITHLKTVRQNSGKMHMHALPAQCGVLVQQHWHLGDYGNMLVSLSPMVQAAYSIAYACTLLLGCKAHLCIFGLCKSCCTPRTQMSTILAIEGWNRKQAAIQPVQRRVAKAKQQLCICKKGQMTSFCWQVQAAHLSCMPATKAVDKVEEAKEEHAVSIPG